METALERALFSFVKKDYNTGMKKTTLLLIGSLFSIIFLLSGVSSARAQTSCRINSFYAAPTSSINAPVQSGTQVTLYWNTSCGSTHIYGGTIGQNLLPANGSVSAGALTGTTSFTLYADNAASAQTTVYVSGGPYSYNYQCSDSIDNDGNGLIDSNDPGCSGPTDNDESGFRSNSISVLTTAASNVSTTSARINGLVTETSFVSYFEYGTTQGLGSATTPTTMTPLVSPLIVNQTITTVPHTTYYYRLVVETQNTTIRGSIQSFTTPSTDTVVYETAKPAASSNTASAKSSTGITASGVTVTVTEKTDKVFVGDTVEYTINYANNTNKTISNVMLSVVFPQGFVVKQTTEGAILTPTSITATIGTLAPAQTGSAFVEATVGPTTALGETLVTTATLSYTLPSGAHDSAVGYALNHAEAKNIVAGFALGSGFFPSTIFGWLITIIIILIIILIARRIAKAKHAHHKHPAGHGSHHGGGEANAEH